MEEKRVFILEVTHVYYLVLYSTQFNHESNRSVTFNLAGGKSVLALGEDSGLVANLRETTDDLLVSVVEAVDGVWDLGLVAELHNQLLGASEVVSWDLGIQMMDGLSTC